MKVGTKELFEKLYMENNFGELRKKSLDRGKTILIVFGIFVLSIIIWAPLALITFPAIIICFFKFSSKDAREKKDNMDNEIAKIYKSKIIAPILNHNFGNIQYFPEQGLPFQEYTKAEYIDKYIEEVSEYSSNDHMILPLKIDGQERNIIDVYDVDIRRIYRSNDRKHVQIIFEGLTSSIELPININTKLKLEFKYDLFGKESFENKNINLDMSEFEKYFEVHCDDQIFAMRIFTSEIMEKLLNIFKTKHHIFDINIIYNKLYIRVYGDNFFEPAAFLNRSDWYSTEDSILALEELEELVKLMYIILEDMGI